MSNILYGRNPVTEALKSGREIEKILMQKGGEGSVKKIEAIARDRKIPIQYVDKAALDRVAGDSGKINHQGVAAYISAYDYFEVDDILERAAQREEEAFVIILDGIEDPHNLGAIIRTADGAGAHGIIIPKRRAAGLTETVAKASAGAATSPAKAVEETPFASFAVSRLRVKPSPHSSINPPTCRFHNCA